MQAKAHIEAESSIRRLFFAIAVYFRRAAPEPTHAILKQTPPLTVKGAFGGTAPPRMRWPAARRFTQSFVTLMQAGVLLRAAIIPSSRAVAEGICATRLDPDSRWGAVFGAGGAVLDAAGILRRAWDE